MIKGKSTHSNEIFFTILFFRLWLSRNDILDIAILDFDTDILDWLYNMMLSVLFNSKNIELDLLWTEFPLYCIGIVNIEASLYPFFVFSYLSCSISSSVVTPEEWHPSIFIFYTVQTCSYVRQHELKNSIPIINSLLIECLLIIMA